MAIRYEGPLDHTFHALGDGTRRQMLSLLATRGECSAGDLGEPFNVAQPTISRHIRVLERAGLVARRVDGRVHRFRLVVAPLREATDWITKQQDFWRHALDALGSVVDEISQEEDTA